MRLIIDDVITSNSWLKPDEVELQDKVNSFAVKQGCVLRIVCTVQLPLYQA